MSMKKRILFGCLIILVIVSCKKQSSISSESANDSLQIAQRQDSIEREKIFEELGDTAFSRVCYGMSKTQYIRAFKEFTAPLLKEKDLGFWLAGYNFFVSDPSSVEDKKNKNINGYSVDLNNIRTEERIDNLFFKEKLFALGWKTFRNYGSYDVVKKSLEDLVCLFERKYGKPNVNNYHRFNFSNIETGEWLQMKVIARWETNKRKIVIYYRELVGSERDKYADELHPSDYQYVLTIHFIDKLYKKEVDEYIKGILQKEQEAIREKAKQDSIKMNNAL